MAFHYCDKCGGPNCTGEVGCKYGLRLTAEESESAKKMNEAFPHTRFARLRVIARAIKQGAKNV